MVGGATGQHLERRVARARNCGLMHACMRWAGVLSTGTVLLARAPISPLRRNPSWETLLTTARSFFCGKL